MVITDYNFKVPLDYHQKEGREISIFAREIMNEKHEEKNTIPICDELTVCFLVQKKIKFQCTPYYLCHTHCTYTKIF